MRGNEYKVVETKGKNDCDECAFALLCITPCLLPSGKHYEKKKPQPIR